MATSLNTWARVRAPVLCIKGTGAGVGVPLAKGGRISSGGVTTDTFNVEYEGPVFLGADKSMLRTYYNPFTIVGSAGFPQGVRTPYFTGDNPDPFGNLGSFTEWASQSGLSTQTITEEQKAQLIGQTVTTTTASFTMTTAAFSGGQSYTPGFEYIVTIGNLTEV
jgi:hypothetical protein